jgi:Fe2+ transport system protein FeoA
MPQSTDPVASSVPLSRAAVGEPRVVIRVVGPARDELEREGLMPGSGVAVIGRTPLGGPVIVQIGRTRLALSRNVAAQVATTADASSMGR